MFYTIPLCNTTKNTDINLNNKSVRDNENQAFSRKLPLKSNNYPPKGA